MYYGRKRSDSLKRKPISNPNSNSNSATNIFLNSSLKLHYFDSTLQQTCVYMWDQRKPLNIRVLEDYTPSINISETNPVETLSDTIFQLVQQFATFNVKRTVPSPTTNHVASILDNGELIVYNLENYQKAQSVLEFSSLKGITITQISCGSNHWLFLSDSGQIYAQGNNTDGQLGIKEQREPSDAPILVPIALDKGEIIVYISSGGRHNVIISSSNRIFSWGSNRNARCGFNTQSEIIYQPTQLNLPDNINFLSAACGWSHSLVLGEKGNKSVLFSFGKGDRGQLGLDSVKHYHLPGQISLPTSEKIVQISAGYDHSAFLTISGKVYTFGGGEAGQLGHKNMNDQKSPTLVSSIEELPITLISCGAFTTLAYYPGTTQLFPPPLFGTTSKLFIWGKCSSTENVATPTEIKYMADKKILQISASTDRVMVLVEGIYAQPEEQQTLYKVVGLPLSDKFIANFACNLVSSGGKIIQGQLYIVSHHMCFFSKVMDKVTKIILPFSEILSIEKSCSGMSIPNGISIFTADKKYSFTVPNDREALFDALCQLWNRHNTPSLSQEHNVDPVWNLPYNKYFESDDKTLDAYGFPLPQEQYSTYFQWAEKYSKQYIKKKHKWEKLLKTKELFQLPVKELKILIKEGIPSEYRGEFWFHFSGASEKSKHSHKYYDFLLASAPLKSRFDIVESIELDVPRTFPNHALFQKTEVKDAIKRILIAYSLREPTIGYCQGMNVLVAVLLLFLSEEKSFWVLCSLIEDGLNGYFTKNLTGLFVDQYVFEEQLGKKIPQLSTHFSKTSFPISAITSKWFMNMYFGCIPTEVALTIWDMAFFDGFRILQLVGAVIFNRNKKILLSDQSSYAPFRVKESTLSYFDCAKMFEEISELKFMTKEEFNQQRETIYTKLAKMAIFQDLRAKEQRKRNRATTGFSREAVQLEKQEDILTYWNQLQQLHSQENGKLNEYMDYINNIISTLHETEREMIKDQSKRDVFLDCLRFFLDNQVVKFCCSLYELNKPQGIRQEILISLTKLLSGTITALLPNKIVYSPIAKIIKKGSKDNLEAFLAFLSVVMDKLKNHPEILSTFFKKTVYGEAQISHFYIFDILLKHIFDEGLCGEYAHEGVFSALLFEDPEVIQYILQHSKFCETMVDYLCISFQEIGNFAKFKTNLQYCDKIIHHANKAISIELINVMGNIFFRTCLKPRIMGFNEYSSSIISIKESFSLIDSNGALYQAFIEFLLGTSSKEESHSDEKEQTVRNLFLRNINADTERSIPTLKLLETLLNIHNRTVMHNLVLRNLIPFQQIFVWNPDDYQESSKAFASLLNSIPGFEEISENEKYKEETKLRIQKCINTCKSWIFEEHLLTRKAEEFYCGLFLSQLFQNLAHFFDNEFETNIILTRIFLKLIHYPFVVLHSYLFSTGSQPVDSSSLYQILFNLIQKTRNQASQIKDYLKKLTKVKQQMGKVIKNIPTNEVNFLQAVIILSEFLKELSAILSFWEC